MYRLKRRLYFSCQLSLSWLSLAQIMQIVMIIPLVWQIRTTRKVSAPVTARRLSSGLALAADPTHMADGEEAFNHTHCKKVTDTKNPGTVWNGTKKVLLGVFLLSRVFFFFKHYGFQIISICICYTFNTGRQVKMHFVLYLKIIFHNQFLRQVKQSKNCVMSSFSQFGGRSN